MDPERHFHPFGGTYPNPSVTGAAIAAATSRVRIRAGSVVAPLHPLRIVGLLGSVDKAEKVVARPAELGVDEVACLIDFGLPTEEVLSGLGHLARMREACH